MKNALNFKGTIIIGIIALLTTIIVACVPTTPNPPFVPTYGTVTDIDGNVYRTFTTRNGQTWMAENLRTTRYNDGAPIYNGIDTALWGSIGAYTVYSNNASNNAIYGKLYNWYAANSNKIAPSGWHVATTNDWEELIRLNGGNSIAGSKLKDTSALWNTPNVGANNKSGFSGLPSGRYFPPTNSYSYLGWDCMIWVGEESVDGNGRCRHLYSDATFVSTSSEQALKIIGAGIRCVKD